MDIDLKDLKKEKNKMRKIYKKAIKQWNLNKIQECLAFIEKYDEIVKQYKYEKYYNMLSPQIKEALRVRDEMVALKDFDTKVYDTFSAQILSEIKKDMVKYNDKALHKMKKDMMGVKKQIKNRNRNRVKHPSKQ